MTEPVSVLFVCLGNICRSTMAEGVFRHMVKQPQYEGLTAEIDSCGTGSLELARSSESSLASDADESYHRRIP
jgi:low molecular weight phosphotyrosine protein phosphatase